MRERLAGTLTLLRLAVRRDRWMVLAWAVAATLLYWTQAVSVDALYESQEELAVAARSMESNAGVIAMTGPPRVLDTVGGQVAWQSSAFGAIVAGLMSMFLVGRHTRAEEESGREELVRSAVVGRSAAVAATTSVVLLANTLLGAAIAGSLIGYGLPVAGSVSLGLAAALAGLVFGATALVAVQVVESVRLAYAMTGAVLGLAFVLRAIGDLTENGLSWLSPIGWGQAMRAYADEVWWPAALSVGAAAILLAVSVVLLGRRDVGSGLWAARRGPATSDLGAAGLAWRLQRTTLLGWAAGLAFVGAAYGSIGNDVGDLLGDSELSDSLLVAGADSLTDAFYGTAALMIALMVGAYAVSAALRPRAEETAGRAEVVLATALSRLRWLLGHAVITMLGTVLVLLVAGLAMGVVLAVSVGDASRVVRIVSATVSYAPAVLVLAGLALVGYGLHPRAAHLGWVGLAFCVVVMMFGTAWQLPALVMDLSPFTHLATMPVEDFAPIAFAGVVTAALALAVAGHVLLLRRDVAGT